MDQGSLWQSVGAYLVPDLPEDGAQDGGLGSCGGCQSSHSVGVHRVDQDASQTLVSCNSNLVQARPQSV